MLGNIGGGLDEIHGGVTPRRREEVAGEGERVTIVGFTWCVMAVHVLDSASRVSVSR